MTLRDLLISALMLSATLIAAAASASTDALGSEDVAHPAPRARATNAPVSAAAPPEAASSEPVSGQAAPLTGQSVATARKHFQRGVDAYRARAYDAALAEFSRAHEIAPHYRILYNLARVQEQRGDFAAAFELFTRYVSEGGERVPEARRAEVEAAVAALEPRLARLKVSTNVDDARLFIDDRPVATLPLEAPLLVNAGIHLVRIEKPGHPAAFRSVTLAGADAMDITLELEPPPRPPPPPAPAAPTRREAPPTAARDLGPFWTSVGMTGALVAATATFGVLTHDARGDLDAARTRAPRLEGDVARARERARTLAIITDTFGLASVLAASAATYLYFSAPSEAPEEPQLPVRAALAPSRAELLWVGTF